MADEINKKDGAPAPVTPDEVLPAEQDLDVADAIALQKAQAEATIRVVDAIGAQVRTVADLPGFQAWLEATAKAVTSRATLALEKQQHVKETPN